jgi:hypothetical protein
MKRLTILLLLFATHLALANEHTKKLSDFLDHHPNYAKSQDPISEELATEAYVSTKENCEIYIFARNGVIIAYEFSVKIEGYTYKELGELATQSLKRNFPEEKFTVALQGGSSSDNPRQAQATLTVRDKEAYKNAKIEFDKEESKRRERTLTELEAILKP